MDESTNILVGLALFLPFVVIVLFLANKQNKEKLEAELRDQLAYEAERTRLRNLKAEQNRQERLTKDAQKIIRKIPPKIKLPEGAKLQELSLDIPNVRTVKGKTQIPSQSSFGSNYEVNISL
jgi:flagellar biosynthesis protein FliP